MDGETEEAEVPRLKPLTREQIDAILLHLPHLEAVARGDFEPGSARMDSPGTVQSDRTYAFFMDMYNLEIVQLLNWTEWFRDNTLPESDEDIASASLIELHKLVIAHVRWDHLAEGYFDEMVESGLFVRILRRLRVLRADL